ncbi:MAG: site-specific integrase, partial [Anaerolineae bacterium]|nr:site-specific integrase [Anaerolineae bacterium]
MFANFVQDLTEQGRSANTIRAYSLDWQHFTRWYEQVNHESLALDRLTALDVQDYVNWSKREGYKPGTINRRLGLIKHVIAWAEDRELVSTELRRRVKRIGIVKKQKLGPKSLEPVAIRKLLRELERTGTARDRAIVYLLLYTGLRVGELVKLRPADVELTSRKGTVTVAATNAKGGKE